MSRLLFLLCFAYLLESGSSEAQAGFGVPSAAESGLALLTFQLPSPKCCNHRHAPPGLAWLFLLDAKLKLRDTEGCFPLVQPRSVLTLA